jgi:ABC-type proline/glycine betaine transport system substrate-binding protein
LAKATTRNDNQESLSGSSGEEIMRKLLTVVSLFVVAAAAVTISAVSVRAENLRIAMVLWRGETPAEKGFKDGLKKLGYTAEFTVVNADQNRTTLRSKFEKRTGSHSSSTSSPIR